MIVMPPASKRGLGLHFGISPLLTLDPETIRNDALLAEAPHLHRGFGTGSSGQAPAPALQPFASQPSCLARCSSWDACELVCFSSRSHLVQERDYALYAHHHQDACPNTRQCLRNEKPVCSLFKLDAF